MCCWNGWVGARTGGGGGKSELDTSHSLTGRGGEGKEGEGRGGEEMGREGRGE